MLSSLSQYQLLLYNLQFPSLLNDQGTKSLTESRVSLNCRFSGEREEMCGLFQDGIAKFWMFAKLYVDVSNNVPRR